MFAPAVPPLPTRPATTPAECGWSLTEMMVTVGILSVLLGLAAATLGDALASARLGTASSGFVGSLALARTEAVRRVGLVAICKSPDGTTCTTAGGWQQGWLTFHDANGNGKADAAEPVIERGAPMAGGMVLVGNQPVAALITFSPSGRTRSAGGGMQAGTLTLCGAGRSAARQIVINSTGRVRVRRTETAICTGP